MLAGDEVVVSKSGKQTHGKGRFYSSIAQRPISGLSLFALSLVDVQQRRAYPLSLQQRLPVTARQRVMPAPKRGRGRPKGSKNHAKTAPILSPELTLLGAMLRTLLGRIASLQVKHLVLDGFFGNYPATWMTRECGLPLISKRRHNAALYLAYTGNKPRRGPTPRYGDKLDSHALPESARIFSVTEGTLLTETYQLSALHKDFPDPLNLVVLVKTHLKTGKRAHVLLFSTDLSLSATQLVDYYSLRFQIEFNFRDAKQHWGLEDFMNISAQAVTNAAHLAFLMVNLSAVLLQSHRQREPDSSVLDLKCYFRACRYLDETIKLLPDSPAANFIPRLWQRLVSLGSIRPPAQLRDAA